MIVDLISFRLGQNNFDSISERFEKFYIELGEMLSIGGWQLASLETRTTYPIEKTLIEQSPHCLYSMFTEEVQKISEKAEVLIVDISHSHPEISVHPRPFIYLCRAINDFIKITKEKSDSIRKLIVLHPLTLKVSSDSFEAKLVNDICQDDRIIFISNKGDTVPKIRDFPSKDYEKRLFGARGESIDLLKIKMIPRQGHFYRLDANKKHFQCVSTYYDGRYCVDEISDLMTTFINNKYGNEQPNLLYDSKSDWLRNVALRINRKSENSIQINDIEDLISKEGESLRNQKYDANKPYLLMLPFIFTGEALRHYYRRLSAKYPSMNLNVISVLSAHPQGDDTHRENTIGDETGDITYNYFMKVEPGNPISRDICPMCKLKIDEDDPNTENYPELTSFSFWNLVKNTGVGTELHHPECRDSLECVPLFHEMCEKYGAWIASKMAAWIEDEEGNTSLSNYTVVCPDEKKEVSCNSGSRSLSNCLRYMFNVGIIYIPRDDIDTFSKNRRSIGDYIDTTWGLQLSSMREKRIVVIDEFSITGSTRRNIIKLLESFGKEVLDYISIADFNPEEGELLGVNCFSLYSWKYQMGRVK